MRKRVIIAMWVLTAFVLGIFGWHVLFPRKFNGKTEREWIRSLNPPLSPAAFRHWKQNQGEWEELGSNSVPILLDALHMKEGRAQRIYSNLWSKLPARRRQIAPAPLDYTRIRETAAFMLSAVGTKYDIPLEPLGSALDDDSWVVRIDVLNVLALKNNDILKKRPAEKEKIFTAVLHAAHDSKREVRMSAAYCLQYFPEDAATIIPVLEKFLMDESDTDVRIRAAMALYKVDPIIAEKAGAATVAGQCMNSKDRFGAPYQAGDFLEEMARTSDAAMAALRDNLFASDSSVRGMAAYHLGKLGPYARSAVPALLRVCREDKESVPRIAAQEALNKIAPEEAAKLNLRPKLPVRD